ncbi:MAG: response regulator [Ruminococcus sp.]|nr:response regulator [Ruminococcus sp.]
MRANSDLLEADNAEDGPKIILKEHPDIIITDMKIPVMDGI